MGKINKCRESQRNPCDQDWISGRPLGWEGGGVAALSVVSSSMKKSHFTFNFSELLLPFPPAALSPGLF